MVGLDIGGTATNATVLDGFGRFLVDDLCETPSRVLEGPPAALEALREAFEGVLALTGVPAGAVVAVGLDTPGPASADGVISSKGSTNFSQPEWRGFDIRGALAAKLGLPVVYTNDANAAALYAHHLHFGAEAERRSSVAAIVGTGLGGGVVESGRVVQGAAGMAGELGHVQIPMHGLLQEGQPLPVCNCGFVGDAESVASLTGIVKNLLPYWLSRYPDHPLAQVQSVRAAAMKVRGLAEAGDELALARVRAAGDGARPAVHDRGELHRPARVLPRRRGGGGGAALPGLVPGPGPEHTQLRDEQEKIATLELVPDRDMAGARGAAIAARDAAEAAIP